jgi:hypothetical protein
MPSPWRSLLGTLRRDGHGGTACYQAGHSPWEIPSPTYLMPRHAWDDQAAAARSSASTGIPHGETLRGPADPAQRPFFVGLFAASKLSRAQRQRPGLLTTQIFRKGTERALKGGHM